MGGNSAEEKETLRQRVQEQKEELLRARALLEEKEQAVSPVIRQATLTNHTSRRRPSFKKEKSWRLRGPNCEKKPSRMARYPTFSSRSVLSVSRITNVADTLESVCFDHL